MSCGVTGSSTSLNIETATVGSLRPMSWQLHRPVSLTAMSHSNTWIKKTYQSISSRTLDHKPEKKKFCTCYPGMTMLRHYLPVKKCLLCGFVMVYTGWHHHWCYRFVSAFNRQKEVGHRRYTGLSVYMQGIPFLQKICNYVPTLMIAVRHVERIYINSYIACLASII